MFGRFIIDDAALYLSDKCSGSVNIRSKFCKLVQLSYFQSFVTTDSSVDVFPDYVCVLDLGMFELSLFTSDGSEQVRTPK